MRIFNLLEVKLLRKKSDPPMANKLAAAKMVLDRPEPKLTSGFSDEVSNPDGLTGGG